MRRTWGMAVVGVGVALAACSSADNARDTFVRPQYSPPDPPGETTPTAQPAPAPPPPSNSGACPPLPNVTTAGVGTNCVPRGPGSFLCNGSTADGGAAGYIYSCSADTSNGESKNSPYRPNLSGCRETTQSFDDPSAGRVSFFLCPANTCTRFSSLDGDQPSDPASATGCQAVVKGSSAYACGWDSDATPPGGCVEMFTTTGSTVGVTRYYCCG